MGGVRRMLLAGAALSCALPAGAQAPAAPLSPHWEDLTGPDFAKALKQAGGVCVLPMGSVEKFGPAGPLGINMYVARLIAETAVKQEYAIIFPPYFAGETADVSNHLGTISYSSRLLEDLLEETVGEMGRNGCTKIVLSNGHSGNNGLISNFISASVARPHPWVVYALYPSSPRMSPPTPETRKMPAAMQPSKPDADGHGGEERIALLLSARPDLVHPERGHDEPVVAEGARHLPLPGGQGGVQVGVARAVEAPTSYLGDASGATPERGRALLAYAADKLVVALRAIKADMQSAAAQQAFDAQRAAPAR